MLDAHYAAMGLSDCVIAYRKLEKSNYDFAADVRARAIEMAPCTILSFDVSNFFGTLDHHLLKERLARILGVEELPNDWYKVFRQVTRFSYIDLDILERHPDFRQRFKRRGREPIATIRDVLAKGIVPTCNDACVGIPQGTPISSALSNLYMIDFDQAINGYCLSHDALYRRYSDDILIVCKNSCATEIEQFVERCLIDEKLTINDDKTERHSFDASLADVAQYLGFNLAVEGATIRQSSISRQWRKVRRSIKRIKSVGLNAVAAGKSDKIYTKTLRRRFTSVPVRNFSSYARRSATALQAPQIRRQLRRLERYVELELAAFKLDEP